MIKKIFIIIFVVGLSFFAHNKLLSQNPDFTYIAGNMCAPVTITFTAIPNCSGNISYNWQSGMGDIADVPNPTFVYSIGNTYTVSLVITCDGVTLPPVEKQIVVFNGPNVSFSNDPQIGCKPLTVSFTNESTNGDAAITSCMWYFGDMTNSTQTNPSHTYNNVGDYEVTLSVTDAHSCTNSYFLTHAVKVSDIPSINFSAPITQHCTPPFNVNFTANITTALNLGNNIIEWNFGDSSPLGSTSNITHTYNNYGNYNVSLTVTDAAGCTNTITKNDYIIIAPVQANYSIANDRDTACKGEIIQITNLTSYSCSWYYNGLTSQSNNLTTAFANAGTYPITFTIDPGGDCQKDTTFNIFIEAITAGFTTNLTDTFFCSAPVHLEITNTSSNNVSTFFYDLGNGISANSENPVFNLPAGTYNPILLVTSANNCSANYLGTQIKIADYQVDFKVNGNHCVSNELEFEYENFNFPFFNINSSTWNFGNGTIINPGNQTENITYSQPGNYNATLSVTTIDNCTVTKTTIVHIGTHYTPTISFLPGMDICPQDTVKFVLDSDHPSCASWCEMQYTWLIIQAPDTLKVPYGGPDTAYVFQHTYGDIEYGIISSHNQCYDTLIMPQQIHINLPIIYDIIDSVSCENPDNYKFKVNAIGADTYDWHFYKEDLLGFWIANYAQNGTTSPAFQHTFSATGSYRLIVIAHNDVSGCTYRDTLEFKVLDSPIVNITSPAQNDVFCIGQQINFNSTTQNADNISWAFGNGDISSITNPIQSYLTGGPYIITLTATNENGCYDIDTLDITIAGVSIDIEALDNYGCQDLHTVFNNISVSNDGMALVTWTFHNGTNQYGNTASFDYSGIGNYDVILTILTDHGCTVTQTFNNYVVITDLNPDFTVSDTEICAGQTITFTAMEQSIDCSYHWNFGDGNDSITTVSQISYTYQTGGNFDVALYVSNIYDCQNSMIKPEFIYVESIEADFSISNPLGGIFTEDPIEFSCYPAEINLIPNVTSNSSFDYYWNMGSGTSTESNPAFVYNQPGTYNITFIPKTPLNCTVNVEHQVIVYGPYAEISASSTSICIGDSIFFEMSNATDVDEFLWILGGGYTSTDSSFYQIYNIIPPSGILQVSLRLRSFHELDTCEVYLNKIINIYQVVANFSILDNNNNEIIANCSPLNVYLTDSSINAASFSWFINDSLYGNNSIENYYQENTTQNVITNTIKLVATHTEGCVDSISKTISLYPLPISVASTVPIICEDDTVRISVTSANNYSYSWSPNYNISDTTIYNPLVYPVSTTDYIVTVSNDNGCTNSGMVTVKVQNRPLLNFDQSTENIIVGEYVDIIVTEIANTDGATYSWEPNYMISCLNCLTPTFQPLHDTKYTFVVVDPTGCFEDKYYKEIIVREIFTVDVPTAFTPLSDDDNNIICMRGYGIKKLKQFRIYDRWGQEVFYTNESTMQIDGSIISKGWDGTFNGKIQSIDNYAYMIEAEMYNGETQIKKGIIMLIK